MKKLLVILLTLTLLTGMFSFAAFADSGNNNGNANANAQKEKDSDDHDKGVTPAAILVETTEHHGERIPLSKASLAGIEINANAENALLNKDAALDRSVGNSEDNADKVKKSYVNANTNTLIVELNCLRVIARENWRLLNTKNGLIKVAFAQFKASLKGSVDAIEKMDAMKATLSTYHKSVAQIHSDIRKLRELKEKQWAMFKKAISKGRHGNEADKALAAALKEIVRLKIEIINKQVALLNLKDAILLSIGNATTRTLISSPGTVVALTKVYDGNTDAVVTAGALSGLITTSSAVTVAAVAFYATPTVGENIVITVNYTLGNVDASKYYIIPITTTGSITAKPLTITPPAIITTKVSDGSITAVVTPGALIGVVSGDAITVTAVATYDNASIGTGKTITVVYTLAGEKAINYIKPDNYVVTNGAITAP